MVCMYIYIDIYIYIYIYIGPHISIFGSAYKATYIAGGKPAEVMKKSWRRILWGQHRTVTRTSLQWLGLCIAHQSWPSCRERWGCSLLPGGSPQIHWLGALGWNHSWMYTWSGLIPAFPEQLASNLPRRVERPVTEFALAESTSLNEELLNIAPKYCGYSCPRMSNSKCIWGSSLTSAPFQHQMVGIRRLRAPTSSVFCQAWPSGYVPFPMECWPRSGSVLKHCGKEEAPSATGGGWGS